MAWSQTALTNPANAQMDAANAQREKAVTAMSASIDRQKASVRRQKSAAMESGQPAGGASEVPAFFVTDALIQQAQSVADCDRLPAMQLEPLIARAARANQVSADLVRAVMRQESAFRPCAVSDKGAMGLMQLMPATATDLGVSDAFDPEENAFAGAKLLRSLMARYHGDLNRTLGAYNAGPANVDAADGPPDFPETTGYIDKITQALGISPASQ
jgi:soluble lytic murein transglycosylase-like protein